MCQIGVKLISSPNVLLIILWLVVINELFIMCLALHKTGWCLWPVKGSLNNQCDLIEVLLASVQFKRAALFGPFLFLFGLFLNIISLMPYECCLRGIFCFEKGHLQPTALLLTTSAHLYNLSCVLPESKQPCLLKTFLHNIR